MFQNPKVKLSEYVPNEDLEEERPVQDPYQDPGCDLLVDPEEDSEDDFSDYNSDDEVSEPDLEDDIGAEYFPHGTTLANFLRTWIPSDLTYNYVDERFEGKEKFKAQVERSSHIYGKP